MSKCPYCGGQHVPDAKFCSVTGKPLPSAPVPAQETETMLVTPILPTRQPAPVVSTFQPQALPTKKRGVRPWLIVVLIVAVLGCIVVSIGGLFAYRGTQGEGPLAMLATATKTTRPTKTDIPTKTPSPTLTLTPTPTITPTQPLGIGSSMLRDIDGMPMVYVPKGEFRMGNDEGDENEKPAHSVYLDAYWIDQHEVTNAQYALCVAAGSCTVPSSMDSSTRSNYYGTAEFAEYPVIFVEWYQAQAYCQWTGSSLPTEAQWEKAARGTEGYTYPWGETEPTCSMVNFNNCVGDTTAAGSFPEDASPYGAHDMAGNVWEWVADWWSPDYYTSSPYENPTGPASGEYHPLRGGAYFSQWYWVTTSFRVSRSPTYVSFNAWGFRCAAPAGGQ